MLTPPEAGSESQRTLREVPVDAVDLVSLHGCIVAERTEEVVAPAARALLAAHRGPLLTAEVAHLQQEGVHQVNSQAATPNPARQGKCHSLWENPVFRCKSPLCNSSGKFTPANTDPGNYFSHLFTILLLFHTDKFVK